MKTMEKFNAKIKEVVKKCEGKNVILYGYGESGQFLEWYFQRIYRKEFVCVIDEYSVYSWTIYSENNCFRVH